MFLRRTEAEGSGRRRDRSLLTNGTDVFEVKRGQREVWSILRQPGQRGFPWVILDLSQTVADVRESLEAEQRKVGLS
jgi:hypothetical protein